MDNNEKSGSGIRIGLALGSGSARGWAHIGILRELADQGIEPDIICGASIGALVGAAYAAGNLDKLEQWTRSLTRLDTIRFFDINTSFNGFIDTRRLQHFLHLYVADAKTRIEDLARQYAAIATDLESGREIWLTKGAVIDAVCASISLPGLFPPVRQDHRWLIDGGLVNPVPVSVCRALGAELVIAVNLNDGIVGKHFRKLRRTRTQAHGLATKVAGLFRDRAPSFLLKDRARDEPPGLVESLAASVNITQDRITRSRMAGDPPDLLLSPKLSHIGLLEFYRAAESIDVGRKCVQAILPELQERLASG